jgi:hypothetical protein
MRHGTRYAYRRKHCHCPDCRAWNTAQVAAYRARRIAAGHDRRLVFGNQNGRGWDRWPRNVMLRDPELAQSGADPGPTGG